MSKSLISGFYPGGETVLNLETVVRKCIAVAGNIYDVNISFESNNTQVFVSGLVEQIVPEIAQMLDYICLSGREVFVELRQDEVHRQAFLAISSDGNKEKAILSFDLYGGIPDRVISDIDAEEGLDKFIMDCFEKAAFVRGKLGEIKG